MTKKFHRCDDSCTHKPRGRPKKKQPTMAENSVDDIQESVVENPSFREQPTKPLLDEVCLLDAKLHHVNRADVDESARFIIDECRRKLRNLVDQWCK
jgi:hypothetical protein